MGLLRLTTRLITRPTMERASATRVRQKALGCKRRGSTPVDHRSDGAACGGFGALGGRPLAGRRTTARDSSTSLMTPPLECPAVWRLERKCSGPRQIKRILHVW